MIAGGSTKFVIIVNNHISVIWGGIGVGGGGRVRGGGGRGCWHQQDRVAIVVMIRKR